MGVVISRGVADADAGAAYGGCFVEKRGAHELEPERIGSTGEHAVRPHEQCKAEEEVQAGSLSYDDNAAMRSVESGMPGLPIRSGS